MPCWLRAPLLPILWDNSTCSSLCINKVFPSLLRLSSFGWCMLAAAANLTPNGCEVYAQAPIHRLLMTDMTTDAMMGAMMHTHTMGITMHTVMAYFDLSSYLYLSRLIHDASLIIYKLSVPPACLHHMYIRMCACVNAYWTYLLSRYLAVNYLTSQRVFSHSTFLFRTHIPTLT